MSNRNEEDIRADYCAGILSIQKVADKHGLKKSTLIDLAERRGWVRNKAPAKVVKKNRLIRPKNPTKMQMVG